MTKRKLINELLERVDALENEFNTLLSSLISSEGKEKISYEEVIDEWLCGKKK